VSLREIFEHTTVRFLLAVAVILGGSAAYGRVTAPWRIAPDLQARLADGGYADIRVVLPFGPEQFHVNLLQQVGTVRGVQGNTVLVGRVPAAEVWRLARHYWIRRIEPLASS